MCSECNGPLGTSDTSMLCEEGLSHLLHIIVLELLRISQIQGKTNGGFGKERSGCSYYTEFLIETLWGEMLMKQEFILNHLYTFERFELDSMKR